MKVEYSCEFEGCELCGGCGGHEGSTQSQNGNEVFAGIFWARPLWNKIAQDLTFQTKHLTQVLKTSYGFGHRTLSRVPPTEVNLS